MRAFEHQVTGTREAVITSHLLTRGELRLGERHASQSGSQPIPGWFQDPYDPGFSGRVLNALSDDARFDALFPDHPLSRVRACFARIRRTLEIDTALGARLEPMVDTGNDTAPPLSIVSSAAVGSLCLLMGRPDEAERVLTSAPNHPEGGALPDPVGAARHHVLLGFALDGQGRPDAAEYAFRDATRRFERELGEGHLEAAQAMNNLGRMLITQGKPDEAELFFRRALKVFEADEWHVSDVGVALNGLGFVCNARQRYAEAIPYFERALERFERVEGPDSCEATVLRNMALSWRRLGDNARMVEAWQRAESIVHANRPQR